MIARPCGSVPELIEDGLGCRVAEEYGSRDAGLVASECPHGGLHVNGEGIHAELLGPAGSPESRASFDWIKARCAGPLRPREFAFGWP